MSSRTHCANAVPLSLDAIAEERKSILVTGASTGIGRHLAESLAEAGHHVYAGARKDGDLAELGAIENITAVRLDVTKQDQVDAAAEKSTSKPDSWARDRDDRIAPPPGPLPGPFAPSHGRPPQGVSNTTRCR